MARNRGRKTTLNHHYKISLRGPARDIEHRIKRFTALPSRAHWPELLYNSLCWRGNGGLAVCRCLGAYRMSAGIADFISAS